MGALFVRAPAPVDLAPKTRKELQKLVRSRTVEARYQERARIVLLAADGWNNSEIADELGIDTATPPVDGANAS